ncbi:MAG: hypothetical protein OXB99_16145 [Acidimicrobiaceae bacterium]|nr:hypothetical protein [Acidimicrobiaceae bacterium]
MYSAAHHVHPALAGDPFGQRLDRGGRGFVASRVAAETVHNCD